MEQDKIWDYFQNDAEVADVAFVGLPRYRFLAARIQGGMHALNIGVGHGGLEKILCDKQVVVSALDPSEVSISRLQEALQLGERAQVGYSQQMPFSDGMFDVVVMSEVIEHLDDVVIAQTLREVRRVLKPGGRFIGTVPADESLLENVAICPCCGKKFHRWGHVQSFSRERLRSILEHDGFRVTQVSRHDFSNYARLNWKGKTAWLIRAVLRQIGIRGDGETFYFESTLTQ